MRIIVSIWKIVVHKKSLKISNRDQTRTLKNDQENADIPRCDAVAGSGAAANLVAWIADGCCAPCHLCIFDLSLTHHPAGAAGQ
ncbi:hypothetical protein [Herbaspirillum autotrophicum]|uniref:hypothetical protein n=1 Tax=Herbaspirillum autotrophicum TaxID=180195 RepID=UPI0012ED73FD|nr:hypothetical protein [Herbaspirillum autotrophicum]